MRCNMSDENVEQIGSILRRVLIDLGIPELLENIENNTLQNSKPFMNIDELSGYLKLSKHSIYSLVSRGELPVFKRTRHLMFSREEIDRWVLDKKYKVHSNKEVISMASIHQLKAK
jgi:excisionase family DNA binding protein